MKKVHNLSISSFSNRAVTKNIFKVIKAMIFIAIIFIVVLFLEQLLQNQGSIAQRNKAIEKKEKNSIDIMFIGNSHAYCTFDPEIIEKFVGKRAYNAGLPGQKIDVNYYTLKETLSRQNPEIIVLEAFGFGRTDPKYDGFIANLDSMDLSLNKINTCFSMFEDKFDAIRMSSRLFRCHNNWKNPGVLNRNLQDMLGAKSYKTEIGNGFLKLQSRMTEDTINKYKEAKDFKFPVTVDDYTKDYFNRIVELCKQKEIRLVVTMAPFNTIYKERINYSDAYEQMKRVCAEAGVEYLDFNLLYKELDLSFDDFENIVEDGQHMNMWGAEKVSTYFAKYLSK